MSQKTKIIKVLSFVAGVSIVKSQGGHMHFPPFSPGLYLSTGIHGSHYIVVWLLLEEAFRS